MAKELPYFKFEPNQWENGNIQMLSREDKGLFIDLCSMYWSRSGDLPYKLALQKLCGGNAVALISLCDENIIEVIDGYIFIRFLSEQLNEFDDLSKKNSQNAKERWKKHREQKALTEKNATASISHCQSDAIREEKIREEKIREEKIREEKIRDENVLLEKEPKTDIFLNQAIQVIEHLNKMAGREFRTSTKSYTKLISARLKDGSTLQDMKDVIDMKVIEWLHDPKMNQYLCPDTLFNATKFEKYREKLNRVKQNPLQFKQEINAKSNNQTQGLTGIEQFKANLRDRYNR